MTNIREGNLKFEIFRFNRYHNNILNNIIIDFGKEFITRHNIEFRILLREISDYLNEPNIYTNHIENIAEVMPIIGNYVINQQLTFNNKYDKYRGEFGLRYFLFIPYHMESVQRNGNIYYYPDERWEGFGLKIHCQEINGQHICSEDIFKSENWIYGYCNLTKTQCSLRINNIRTVIVQDNNNSSFGLVLQCKIMKSSVRVDNEGNVTLINPDHNSIANYIIPIRLLKKHLDN